MSATKLVAEMGQGNMKAEVVVVAFLKRSVLGHQLVDHIFIVCFDGMLMSEPVAEFCNGVLGR